MAIPPWMLPIVSKKYIYTENPGVFFSVVVVFDNLANFIYICMPNI